MVVQTIRVAIALLVLSLVTTGALGADARPNQLGQTGLIHMPDGRLADDATLRFGVGNMNPYLAAWGSITLVPWLELSGRYTRTDGVPAFGNQTGFGDTKDKAFDFKLRLLEETKWLPALAFGRQDFHGTRRFNADFVSASKEFTVTGIGTFDLSAGYGNERIDGAFGGIRFRPEWSVPIAFVAEYDAFDYENDARARFTGDTVREGGLGVGVEYTYGWLSSQLSHQDGKFGFNVGFSVPLQQRTFAAKTDEPQPVPLERPAAPVPADPPEPALEPIFDALTREGFYGIRALVDGTTLRIAAGSHRYSTIGRAASRAGRVVALLAPEGIDTLELTFLQYSMPIATYRFADLDAYRGWLAGTVPPPEFQKTLSISYVDTADWQELKLDGLDYFDFADPADEDGKLYRGSILSGYALSYHRTSGHTFRWVPLRLGYVFNDPDGIFKYDVYTNPQYYYRFNNELYFASSVAITLSENISETVAATESDLPHVRSDAPEYARQSGRAKLYSAYLGYQAQLADRTYTWLTAGVLEQMFSGVGGELLYLPETGNWAVDLQAYAVKQRDFKGRLGHQDYETLTALLGVHYRIPKMGLTLSASGGRFLAKDTGVKFEVKRRFLSNFEVGAWYTVTDANDIHGPASPGNPYRDKGVFLRIAAGPLLPHDADAYADFEFRPWLRDPGATVHVAGRLYDYYERRLMLNLEDLGPWSDFGQ